ncbi:MAG TPA: hypothetical protein V6D27_10455, partial [Vampirovibrionales bacterium]
MSSAVVLFLFISSLSEKLNPKAFPPINFIPIMMKPWCLWIFASLFTLGLILWVTPAQSRNKVDADCTYNDISLYGKVQIVESFPDLKIQIVASFPDLRVKMV